MKAFVLAAGFGTRLKPLTDTTPKPLVPVRGTPLILYALALLKTQGITDITINVHHLAQKITAALGDGRVLGLQISYSHENPILGTGGGIAKVLPKMSSEFIVINSDVVTDLDFGAVLKTHHHVSALATLVLRALPPASDLGVLTYSGDRVTSILSENPPAGHPRAHFTGLQILSREQLQNFLKGRSLPPAFCIVRNVYQPVLQEPFAPLAAFVNPGFWQDCGSHAALSEMATATLNLSYSAELQRMTEILRRFYTIESAF